MSSIESLVKPLEELRAAPSYIRKIAKQLGKRYSDKKVKDRWSLLRCGFWLSLEESEEAAHRVFEFLNGYDFTGDFTLWVATEVAITFLLTSPGVDAEFARGIRARIFKAGFVEDRLSGHVLERSITKFRLSHVDSSPTVYECYVLEEILVEINVMRALGPRGEYSESRLLTMKSEFESKLHRFAINL